MSKVKNKQMLYVVMRLTHDQSLAIETYLTYESADQRAVALYQEMKDRGIIGLDFQVQATIYYDE